jgi:hypothetical protein
MPNYATYHVAMKLLLCRGDEVLVLRDAKTSHFDLPGGRIEEYHAFANYFKSLSA